MLSHRIVARSGLLIAILLFQTTAVRGQAPKPPHLSVAEIYQIAMERHKSIRNVKVETLVTWKKLRDIPGKTNSLLGHNCTFAFDGESRYMKDVPLEKVTDGAVNLSNTYSYTGDQTFVIQNGVVLVHEGKAPGCENGDYYCREFLDIPITDKEKAQYDNAWYFPHCVRPEGQKFYTVLPQLEEVDGAWCHVLFREKRDKIWVDPKLGGAYRRRERYMDDDKGKTIAICTYSASDFTEAAPKVWVPRKCKRVDFAVNAPAEYLNKPYLELHLDVKHVALNQVTEEDFNLSVPPETIVVNQKASFQLPADKAIQLPGDKSYVLDGLAKEARRRESGTMWRWFGVAIVLATGLVIAGVVYQRKKKAR